jgi:hypothetical protein
MRVSGLGERGTRLRKIAGRLKPAPIAVYYVQVPDEIETRAVGWYMRRTRTGEPEYLGHSAAAAEAWLRGELDTQTPVRKRAKKGQKALR